MAPRAGPGDHGSATLELVALTPVLLALVLAIVAAARITAARQEVDAAAREAARAASLAPTLTAAQHAATTAAAVYLDEQRLSCAGMSVTVTGDYSAPPGTPAAAHARVTCTATLADLALPGLPGSRALSASYSAVLDTYSQRGGP